jgi:hypothetical protein
MTSETTSKKFTIKTERIVASALQPGDLFSTIGSDYWDDAIMGPAIGEKVYIRTHTPSDRAPDSSLIVYKLTIHPTIEPAVPASVSEQSDA